MRPSSTLRAETADSRCTPPCPVGKDSLFRLFAGEESPGSCPYLPCTRNVRAPDPDTGGPGNVSHPVLVAVQDMLNGIRRPRLGVVSAMRERERKSARGLPPLWNQHSTTGTHFQPQIRTNPSHPPEANLLT